MADYTGDHLPSEAKPGCKIIPIIMSGGAGTRLWPLSTEREPKQFHALTGARTMLQNTVMRFREPCDVEFLDPVIICNRQHEQIVASQLADLGVSPSAIILEPFGRNTAAVAVMAALIALDIDPEAKVLLLPADHVIADEKAFRASVAKGAAVDGRLVTFGIHATAPETGYGYIQRGGEAGEDLYAVARFAEKPTKTVAQAYLTDGGYYWNAGIFLFSPSVLLAEMQTYRPDILTATKAAVAAAELTSGVVRLTDELFAQVPSESIDIAIMERTRLAVVAPCDAGWADIGSWGELWRLGDRDGSDNLMHGPVAAIDTQNSLIWSQGAKIAVLGLSDIVVVESNGSIIVLPKSRCQEVKALVQAATSLG